MGKKQNSLFATTTTCCFYTQHYSFYFRYSMHKSCSKKEWMIKCLLIYSMMTLRNLEVLKKILAEQLKLSSLMIRMKIQLETLKLSVTWSLKLQPQSKNLKGP